MGREVCFSDYINILTSDYDTIVFNPVFSEIIGVYLYCEGEKPIKYITLDNYIITIYYIDGEVKSLKGNVISVDVDDVRFKRRMKIGINGNLFKYSKEDALYYNLDMSMAFPKSVISKIRKKI